MKRNKLIAAFSAVVAAMIVIAVCVAILSREPASSVEDRNTAPGTAPAAEEAPPAKELELVKINWKTAKPEPEEKGKEEKKIPGDTRPEKSEIEPGKEAGKDAGID